MPTGYNDTRWNNVRIDDDSDGYRLPTERQWEFAAKGGTQSAGYTGTSTDKYFVWSGIGTDSSFRALRGGSYGYHRQDMFTVVINSNVDYIEYMGNLLLQIVSGSHNSHSHVGFRVVHP